MAPAPLLHSVDAGEALRRPGVRAVLTAEDALDAPVDALRGFSPIARRTAKKLRRDTEDSPLAITIELEQNCRSRKCRFEGFREGLEAFHAERRPRFSGR